MLQILWQDFHPFWSKALSSSDFQKRTILLTFQSRWACKGPGKLDKGGIGEMDPQFKAKSTPGMFPETQTEFCGKPLHEDLKEYP